MVGEGKGGIVTQGKKGKLTREMGRGAVGKGMGGIVGQENGGIDGPEKERDQGKKG